MGDGSLPRPREYRSEGFREEGGSLGQKRLLGLKLANEEGVMPSRVCGRQGSAKSVALGMSSMGVGPILGRFVSRFYFRGQ